MQVVASRLAIALVSQWDHDSEIEFNPMISLMYCFL
jgi:hypothetical protein